MGRRFRRFLAATQFAGGLAVLAGPPLLMAQGYSVTWWYWILLESFGGTAVAAGFWLWRDDPRGWHLSRLMQAMQLLQFQVSGFGVSAIAGFQLRILIAPERFDVGPSFNGMFSITGASDQTWVNINLFGVYALYLLLTSGPAAAVQEAPLESETSAESLQLSTSLLPDVNDGPATHP
jgi:hypothetical protein